MITLMPLTGEEALDVILGILDAAWICLDVVGHFQVADVRFGFHLSNLLRLDCQEGLAIKAARNAFALRHTI